jgi:hypothetical protein
VFDPNTGAWYAASSPLPPYSRLLGHALVTNKAEGMLLALGGTAKVKPALSAWAVAPADVWNHGMVANYDIRAGGLRDTIAVSVT